MTESRRYDAWAGNPAGVAEDPTRCVETVADASLRFTHYCQCRRKRGHGPDGLYCRQHDPVAAAERVTKTRRASEVRFDLEILPLKITRAARDFFHQRGSLDDLEALVGEYERLLDERGKR